MAAHKDCQQKDYDKLFDDICNDIVELNMSASKALEGRMSFSKFYEMLDESEDRAKKYARACVLRAERVNDEIIDIADDSSEDTLIRVSAKGDIIEKENTEYINRSRVRIDARKWWLSKTNPKKYGDKLDLSTNGEKINQTPNINLVLEGKPVDLSLSSVRKTEE